MEEAEYKDKEKVLYKTSGKAKLLHKNPQEVELLVTEGHVVIEADESIKIPLSHIKHCGVTTPFSGTAELYFLDTQKQERMLSVEVGTGEQIFLQRAIYRQIVGRFLDEAAEPSKETALGEFFFKVKEIFRDKTRDDVCAGLQKLGIDAHMVTRGRIEEEIGEGGSLGIIHIPEGPIRWINICKETHWGHEISNVYYTEYGIPDTRLGSDLPLPYICAVRKNPSPAFGKVVNVAWEGEDCGTGVISRLNSNDQLKEAIMMSRDVAIEALGDYGCWIMSTKTRIVPSKELFSYYQTIANHLLAEWKAV